MSVPTEYEGVGQIQFDGRTLAEADNVSVRHAPNNNRVYTMRKGLAGFSKGAFETEISVTNAVPKGGLEADFIEKAVAGSFVRITVLFAGKRYQYNGWIDSDEHSNGSQESATFSFTVVAGKPTIV